MGTAYTPGLKVSAHTTIEKLRRLPLKGTVLVDVGQAVLPDTVVARTELPGLLQSVRVAERLGIEPNEVPGALRVAIGDSVTTGALLAETRGLFGRFFRGALRSPVTGKVEFLSSATGNLGIREAPTPVERNAYIQGVVSEVLPEEGVVVRCEGAMAQGIFGVGGERLGPIAVVTASADQPLTAQELTEAHQGKIVVGGAQVTGEALRRAAEIGIVGIVCGGVLDRELMDYLAEALRHPGYDIGVAITGQEPIPFTLILTEGFGVIRMAERTFALFRSLEGQIASINGATQIRAGVIRPEVIVPYANGTTPEGERRKAKGESLTPESAIENRKSKIENSEGGQLGVGTPIRVIREPYFGLLGTVTALPSELTPVESGTLARVLQAQLEDGRHVTVPRANVELIQYS